LAKAAATDRETVTPVDANLAAHQKNGVADGFFEVVMPLYLPGTAASTIATSSGHERAVLGWAVGLYSATPLLERLVTATPGLSISIHHADAAGATTVATAGATVAGAIDRVVSVGAGGRWSATVAVVPSASATAQAIGVLTDLLVIVLLVALIVVLLRSRRRAIRSIECKNEELHHRALHDTLTGLPNRDLMVETTEAMLARAGEEHGAVAALLIDLDNLTWINNTYGHRVGDSVLVNSARRIERTLGPGDLLGRLAGDEFVVLADAAAGAAGPGGLAERVLDALSEPMRLSEEGLGVVVRITACIGVAVGAGCRSEELLRDADTALTEAKAAGSRRIGRFEPGMHRAARDRLAMTGDLQTALEEGQFFVVYQPVFELPGLAPIGVEALVRWRHPLRGVVPPSEFIALLEDTGTINQLGHEVLREACRQGEEWQRRGLHAFVSVNASALELESDGFVAQVAQVLEDTGLDPHHLSIELTESALMRDAPGSIRRLANLKSLGIRIAIDDFGTGYSSLAYLRQFPVDIVKIDRSFVVAMTTSPGGMALVRTMLELARALGLHSVAEGIEDRHQLDALVAEHCDAGQGFLLSKPLEADQIELFFDNARPRNLMAVLGSR
jgi:diguanylate cyclase (GGDEF)-like protein